MTYSERQKKKANQAVLIATGTDTTKQYSDS